MADKHATGTMHAHAHDHAHGHAGDCCAGKKQQDAALTLAKDPVCGMSVDPAQRQAPRRARRAPVLFLLRRLPR